MRVVRYSQSDARCRAFEKGHFRVIHTLEGYAERNQPTYLRCLRDLFRLRVAVSRFLSGFSQFAVLVPNQEVEIESNIESTCGKARSSNMRYQNWTTRTHVMQSRTRRRTFSI